MKVYVGTVGLKIEVETRNNDLSTASLIQLLVKKPDGSEVIWPATYEGTKVVYTTKTGDLDQSGLYYIQAYVEFPDGSRYYGETDSFPVVEEFE